MPEFNLHLDTTAYNVVIRLLCEKGDMDIGHKLMIEIGLIDLYPDMRTYFAKVKGFCNAGRLEEACELFQAMKGQGFSPNVVAYFVLLDGICKHMSTRKALELLGEMDKACRNCSLNCVPNCIIVITLITGLCVEGHVKEACKLIDRVTGRGVSNSDCYSSLVLALIRINKLDEAEKLFRKMLVSGAKPSAIACSTMIREICHEGQVLDSFCLYNEIERMQYFSSIDTKIYSILLVGLCQQSHSVEATKLARLMLRKRIRLKAPYDEIIMEANVLTTL
ncbi:hypothetical protein Goshw_024503 [Gossypium schwendimanii]|uniref:Pentatricopeptide repeat-containing protein n=1 Tax=Gossypium schwendimanii TaxID=34291 RepID=A0A7J9LBX3_GOSSC|nr:hypothetical protein [Gossypium schwendimanii]